MFNDVYKNKRVLITGHTGFKGSWMAVWLKMLGADVYGMALEPYTKPSHFEILGLKDQIKSEFIDVRNKESVRNYIKETNPEIIFHLAANAIVKDCFDNPTEAFETNSIGSLNILTSLNEATNLKSVVMITSDKCYENVEWEYGYREDDALGGKDPYSASKACAEIIFHSMFRTYFKDSNFNIATARAGNVIGGGDWANSRIVPDCIRAWSSNESVEIRSPNATRPWQHVLEPLSGYLHLGASLYLDNEGVNGESFNFGPSAEVNQSVSHLIDEMKVHWQKANWHSAEKQEQFTKSEAKLLKLCCDKAYFHLQWLPNLNFNQTVEMTVNWYKEYYSSPESNIWDLTCSQIERYQNIAKEKNLVWGRA